MALVEATRSTKSVIYWAVTRAMTLAEFDAYAVSAVTVEASPRNAPKHGTVTLGNGGVRKAERIYGQFSGQLLTRYQAPNGGRWHVCSAKVAATFVPKA